MPTGSRSSWPPTAFVTVTDNGRGIPVDPHPKFKNKSALEVIMSTLHAGGKFDSKVYETSGGLHGVGVSVANALSERMEVEVARGQKLYRMAFERGKPKGKLQDAGKAPNRRGTKVRFRPDPQIFGAKAHFRPERVFKMTRSKAYLFGGVEIRWSCDKELLRGVDRRAGRGDLPFRRRPEGLSVGDARRHDAGASGHLRRQRGQDRRAWRRANGRWPGRRTPTASSTPTATPSRRPMAARTNPACAPRCTRGLKDHAERVGQGKRAAAITSDDVMTGAGAMLSVFIREPEFQGQTKDRLATAEAQRIVEQAIKDPFDHWLAGNPLQANKLLDFVVERAEERVRRRQEKEIARKSAVRKLRLPGKLADCTNTAADGAELFIVEGDSAGGSAKQARDRASQAVLPLRGKILNVACAGKDKLAQNQQLADLIQALGCGTRRALPRRGSALRPRHHHDRRRRRRRPHRLAADHLLLPGDAAADRQAATSISRCRRSIGSARAARSSTPATTKHKRRAAEEGIHANAKVEIGRFKGLGEMMAAAAQGNHHGPEEAHAAAGRSGRGRAQDHGQVGRAADGQQARGRASASSRNAPNSPPRICWTFRARTHSA